MTAGLPESPPFCLEGLLPDGPATQHREFRTELTIYANQIIAVPGDESAAAELAALLDQAIERCASEYEEKYPGAIAEYRDYGTLSVEDGARVHGLHTSVPQGDSSVVLLAVGRDGDAVTVVRWSDMNDFDRAPVTEFQDTATAAVEGLY
ncbi:hypothetical protein [Streptomyces phytophilus]|uniref:hypothetical protein n=1 Tax=Streptomyces phytophilus TaxID=722715 RepID=UPI001C68B986|nr:hypothetical protein [Streptomyces phytophilus]